MTTEPDTELRTLDSEGQDISSPYGTSTGVAASSSLQPARRPPARSGLFSNNDSLGPDIRNRLFKTSGPDGVRSRADNPFLGWRPAECDEVARLVAEHYHLDPVQDLFIKAAWALKHSDTAPHTWRSNAGCPLSDTERTALENETTATFWDQPWPLKTSYTMLFIAALLQGWNQTGTNGANLQWPTDLGLYPTTPASACSPPRDEILWYAGVNAAPYFSAGVGCWLSDVLVNKLLFGRRGAIALSALLILASSIAGFLAEDVKGLLISRVLLGIGMGNKAAVVPVFAAEIAPAHLRGVLTMNWQVFDSLGIFLGFLANLVASLVATKSPSSVWRWQIASSTIPSFALLCGVVFICWDSPRFLMKHEQTFYRRHVQALKRRSSLDRRGEPQGTSWWLKLYKLYMNIFARFRRNPGRPYLSPAYYTFCLLREHPIIATKELLLAHAQLIVETLPTDCPSDDIVDISIHSSSSWLTRLTQLYTQRFIRREVVAAAIAMLSQQACGINVLFFFSTTLFCSAGDPTTGNDDVTPLALSMGLGLVNFLFAIPAYTWIETKGRRWLLLAFTLPMAALMSAAAASYYISDSTPRRIVVALWTYLFTALYSFGLGPVPFVLSAEIFPLEQRMVGMSLAVSFNFFGAGVLAFTVPLLQEKPYLLFIFAGLNVVAFAFIWVFVREVIIPKRTVDNKSENGALSLETLWCIFAYDTQVHWNYQVTSARWWLRRVLRIGRGPRAPLKAFHIWAGEAEEIAADE